MKGIIHRIVALLMIMGVAFWHPGIPLALAQVEITPEVREACQQFEPELRNVALNEVVPRLEEADKPEAAPEAKAEAKIIEQTALSIHDAGTTVAKLEVPDAAKLQETLTQSGMSATAAQELAQKAQSALTEAKNAFAKSDPVKAEATLKAFREECKTRYGVDPSGALGNTGEGKLDLGRVAFDSKGDFLGKAIECHTACDLLQKNGIEFSGAPPSAEEAQKMIDKMNVPPEEKAKMVEMAKAYEGFCKDGSFDKIREIQVTAARESYEKMMGEHGVFTPEMAAKMMAEVGQYHDYAGNVVSPEVMFREMAAGGPMMDPRMMEGMGQYHDYAGNAVSQETMFREMATYREAMMSPTSDTPRTESSGMAEVWHGCAGLSEAEKATHRAHGHCNPTD